ncbi:hypothetical protein B0H15DRAFT_807093 [Mycena belliarum]|uniref:Uncharacterized protein n=1 Tax=Mycena belliarum TaxID=1033014 RepID=A0AAD6TN27_9AGAR|nr:hypothetical protein B0H15DRAFT_807093 [Mycena belliae]
MSSHLATFCDVPLSTRFDGHTTTSLVSLDWVFNSGLRALNSQLSGLLTLPCEDGVISMVLNSTVTASLASDMVLGLDWYNFVKSSMPQLVVHLGSGVVLDLQDPMSIAAAETGRTLPAIATTSSIPRTQGTDIVTGAELLTPCTWGVHTSRTRGGAFRTGDVLADDDDLMSVDNLDDPFVAVTINQKIAIVTFIIENQRYKTATLRNMSARHMQISARESGRKRKSWEVLRTEFRTHRCTEACLF